MRVAQEAAERHRASFHATDLSPDGVKIILLGGVPTLHGDDADRLVRTALEIRDRSVTPDGGRALDGRRSLSVRAGVNTGKVFVFASDFGLGGRRIYSLTGDVVNLAARVAAASSPGEVRCTEATRETLRSPFSLSEMPPFRAKGKAEPVVTYAVGEVVGWRPAGASAGRSGGAPAGFLGRERELESLLEAAEATRRGPAGLAVELVGPAGIGKTRLVDEAVARWRLPTARIAGDSFGLARPYRALRPFARRLLMLDDDAPPGRVAESLRATLERHAPSLLPWAPLVADVLDVSLSPTTEVEELDPRFRRRRLEAAFVELLASLLSGPTALVFEDVHGLDEASASLTTRIAEEASLRPWLVVATRRPDGPGVPPGVLDDRIVIELGPLDAASSGRLLGGLASDALRPGERELLVERAAGNPLFLLELGRAAAASGSVEDLPDGLEPLLASQIDRLVPEERLVLRSAAVLGLRFDEQLLGDLLDDASLLGGRIWERLGEFIGLEGGVRVFRHALLRDAAYEGLSFRRRRQLHARAASAIEARASHPGDAVELLSLHWLAAEQWQPAWDCARLAGEHAAALYANRDAATHFRRALAAARHLRRLDRSEIATVAERLGDVSWLSGAYGQARAAYLTARRGARGEVDRARLLRQLGLLHARQGGLAQALRCFTLARRQLPPGADSPGAPRAPGADAAGPERSELARAAANVLHRQGRLHDSMAFAEVAEREADASGYRLGLAKALNT
ncbi:MAG TPA: AAA family ATPase, partial [Acidimicrobiales bacterium]|nr:AAA family ATPase [Acidimicrobiales bacterium]